MFDYHASYNLNRNCNPQKMIQSPSSPPIPADVPAENSSTANSTKSYWSISNIMTRDTNTQEEESPGVRETIRKLFCLFCCPPCPGPITSKLSFHPPGPSYTLEDDDISEGKQKLKLNDDGKEILENEFNVFSTRTSRGNHLACMLYKYFPTPSFTIMYSHGNGEDLGLVAPLCMMLGLRLGCNIFSYDYSGYGVSGGEASEDNMYEAVEAAWKVLAKDIGKGPENVILYGFSLGTVATVHLASRHEARAVILQSPLMSGLRTFFPRTKRTWFFDPFPSIEKISLVTAPVLVIHGTDDQVISFDHGKAIYEKCQNAVEPLWLEGAGHNDVIVCHQFWERLARFVEEDLS